MVESIGLLNVDFSSGAGVPAHQATKGSLYVNTGGTGVADRLYINTDGSTTWTAISTVA